MLLKQPIQHVFTQISNTLQQLNDAEYAAPSKLLFNASIGQHVRHIIELFQCLETGMKLVPSIMKNVKEITGLRPKGNWRLHF